MSVSRLCASPSPGSCSWCTGNWAAVSTGSNELPLWPHGYQVNFCLCHFIASSIQQVCVVLTDLDTSFPRVYVLLLEMFWFAGPRGILDMPYENTLRMFASGTFAPCLLTLRMEIDKRPEFHRHRKGFVGKPERPAPSLRARGSWKSALDILRPWRGSGSVKRYSVGFNERLLSETKEGKEKEKTDRQKESKSLDRMRLCENQSCDIRSVTPDLRFNVGRSPHIFAL